MFRLYREGTAWASTQPLPAAMPGFKSKEKTGMFMLESGDLNHCPSWRWVRKPGPLGKLPCEWELSQSRGLCCDLEPSSVDAVPSGFLLHGWRTYSPAAGSAAGRVASHQLSLPLPAPQEVPCSRSWSPHGHPTLVMSGNVWAAIRPCVDNSEGTSQLQSFSQKACATAQLFCVLLPPHTWTLQVLPEIFLGPNLCVRVCLLRNPTCNTPSGIHNTYDSHTLPHLIIYYLA